MDAHKACGSFWFLCTAIKQFPTSVCLTGNFGRRMSRWTCGWLMSAGCSPCCGVRAPAPLPPTPATSWRTWRSPTGSWWAHRCSICLMLHFHTRSSFDLALKCINWSICCFAASLCMFCPKYATRLNCTMNLGMFVCFRNLLNTTSYGFQWTLCLLWSWLDSASFIGKQVFATQYVFVWAECLVNR